MRQDSRPAFKGFLRCWTCNQVFADYDVVASASPCVVQCRPCTDSAVSRKAIQRARDASRRAARPVAEEVL